nr:MAG TPA: hypothetical protein [Caudoviricetes sp.]DAV62338.1 MAG TPA: hypothetical protein [Caudoviricetes sp.]DAY96585.1 MAG TPA: hypothetical protein [Caudoviricetes sp.]
MKITENVLTNYAIRSIIDAWKGGQRCKGANTGR